MSEKPEQLRPCPVADSVRAFPNFIAAELCARCPNLVQSPAAQPSKPETCKWSKAGDSSLMCSGCKVITDRKTYRGEYCPLCGKPSEVTP